MRSIVSLFMFGAISLAGVAQTPDTFTTEFIFPKQGEHCHSSTIAELENGDLIAAWFQGSGERNSDDVRVLGARRAKGSEGWSEPFLMADTPNVPDCNPVLHVDPEGRMWLYWVGVIANQWESCLLFYRRADSPVGTGAPDWSWQGTAILQPGEDFADQLKAGFKELGYEQEMWAEYAPPYDELLVEAAHDKLKRRIGWMTRAHMHTLPNGRVLMPLYSDGFNVSIVAYSDDNMATWTMSEPIVGLGPIQPAIARKEDGTLVAFMRDSGPMPKQVMRATSEDNGETWSVARDIDRKGSSASVQVRVLESGEWVLIHNDVIDGRHQLALSVSADEGETWSHKHYLVKEARDAGGFSYPSIIQTGDGLVHATFSHHTPEGRTIGHSVINPDWLVNP
jgi:predicted neuraminidase